MIIWASTAEHVSSASSPVPPFPLAWIGDGADSLSPFHEHARERIPPSQNRGRCRATLETANIFSTIREHVGGLGISHPLPAPLPPAREKGIRVTQTTPTQKEGSCARHPRWLGTTQTSLTGCNLWILAFQPKS